MACSICMPASDSMMRAVHNALDAHYFINLSAVTLPGGVISGNVGDPLMVGFTLKAKL